MKILITGSGGLVGSEVALYFGLQGHEIIGIDNDMRSFFFGEGASVRNRIHQLNEDIPGYIHCQDVSVDDDVGVDRAMEHHRPDVVIHAAAQPSHDWAVNAPHIDFRINAGGTLNLLEATRRYCPDATFIFTSTNKVYGDTPNSLNFVEMPTRWEIEPDHKWWDGIDENMSVDASLHSLFGVSKLSADLMVQEYGRYFGMKTVCFRCGCITGPEHRGAELHGFLSYLMKCAVEHRTYTIYGYKGKQVRDNIHANDLVRAFEFFINDPKISAVYNMGGGREVNCSILEAIDMCEWFTDRKMKTKYNPNARVGDHQWWVSNTDKFRNDYPEWELKNGVYTMLREIHERC